MPPLLVLMVRNRLRTEVTHHVLHRRHDAVAAAGRGASGPAGLPLPAWHCRGGQQPPGQLRCHLYGAVGLRLRVATSRLVASNNGEQQWWRSTFGLVRTVCPSCCCIHVARGMSTTPLSHASVPQLGLLLFKAAGCPLGALYCSKACPTLVLIVVCRGERVCRRGEEGAGVRIRTWLDGLRARTEPRGQRLA